MIIEPRLITRIALFSALIYVFSWALSVYPNVNVVFFIVFSAGFLWGALAGSLVGFIGMGLWTLFNPYGPATLPVMLAQVCGTAACGVLGALFAGIILATPGRVRLALVLIVAATLCTCLYFVPVSLVDAWVFQPFWPRFITGLGWSLLSLVSNVIIFPLLFGITRHLYERERSQSWRNGR